MIYFTIIARIADGLPLAAAMQDDTELHTKIVHYQNQAKQLIRRLTASSPSRCSLLADQYAFHYLLDSGVCYLILTDESFSRPKAFGFLENIQIEFCKQYYNDIHTVSRPYNFLDFDSRSNLAQLNVALQDVQRIMVRNIDDVLRRGEALSDLDTRANNLHAFSKKYRKDAHTLNMQSKYPKYIFFGVLIFVLFIYLYYRFLW